MSNRLTFSLASLILLLGLVFAPMSVMAHEATDENTDTATDAALIHAVGTDATHQHPMITVTIEDADPTTDGIQVADTEADEAAATSATVGPTIQFDVMLTVPPGAQDGGNAVAVGTFDEVTVTAYDTDFLAVGASTAFTGTPVWDQGTGTKTREWTTTVTITFADVDASGVDTTAAQADQDAAVKALRDAVITAAIEKGITVDVTVPDNLIQTSGLAGGPMLGQGNRQVDDDGESANVTTLTIIGGEVTQVTRAASLTKVNGTTPTVVTISLPDGTDDSVELPTLVKADFSVTEAPADTSSTATMEPTFEIMGAELTITPDAAATEDSVITVSTSDDGAKKISLSAVTVNVDRTAPMVTIGSPTPAAPKADQEVMVAVSVTGAATGQAVEFSETSVMQTPTGGTAATLPHKLIATSSGVTLTFTPTAAGAVTVTVSADAVMDDVSNGNMAVSSEPITVAAAAREPVPVTAMAAAATVNGDTDIEVTLSATAPAMVPDDLMASDFAVMEGTTALTPVVGDKDATAGTVTLTITSKGTGDTTVTVNPAGDTDKISFAEVSVMVDRTGPTVEFSEVTGAKANAAVMVTITTSGAATGETIAVNQITVVQTLSDGTAKTLSSTYNAGMVTFTPDAESTVVVSVAADAVMDDLGNGNMATSSDAISVGAADMADSTGPIATITGTQGTDRAFDVTITFDEALGATETLTADEITVTGGTIASVAVDAADAKIYTGTITPNHGVTAVTVQVNAGAVKDASPAMNANVATPATPHSITVRSTTAPEGPPTIASKGYAVFVPMDHDADALPKSLMPHTVADMPNLVDFFNAGGTIDVAVTGKAKHNVIITEIMLAEDLSKRGGVGSARPAASQWIELYNNTDAAIDIKDIAITFSDVKPAAAAPTDATDRVSNVVSGSGWNLAATFEGALSGQTVYNAAADATTVTKDFKSLRRKYKDDKRLQNAGTVIEDGWKSGSWALTADSRVFLAGRIGTPGSENRPTVYTPPKFTAPTMEVTFNEIANRTDDTNEWIELKGAAGTNMKKFKISIVTAYDKTNNTGTEKTVYQFPDNDDTKMPAGGILLLTEQNPVDNEIAADLEKAVPKPVRYKVVTLLEDLPNDGNFLLVLRDTDGNIEDVAGHLAGLDDDDPYTTLWPLSANVGRISAKNKLAGGNVYKRARAIQGYSSNKDNGDEPAFEGAGFSGIGYDRRVSAANKEHHGTPGYPNNAKIDAGAEATDNVVISEIMFADGTDRFAQWIEIHNQSDTNGVDLHNWRLYIINHSENADGSAFAGKILDEVWLRNMKIPPNQTGLIVTRSAPQQTTNLTAPQQLLNLRYDKPLLSSKGFSLRLEAKSHEGDVNKREAGDEVGNLAAADPDNRRADHQAFMDPRWALPAGTDDNIRVSIARLTSPKRTAMGTDEAVWISSADDSRPYGARTYYGRSTDIGTPGHTAGGVLPVSLSKFRPERLDSGEIVVRWITESELNNAGFNILRSEKRDGEFTKLNTKLIAGHGTTSERHTYEWKDTSAKPNVVYYYQIQDVSLDGQVQTLRLSRLKGHISPAGKATTTWGELKALQ